jgi:hypothetical protein
VGIPWGAATERSFAGPAPPAKKLVPVVVSAYTVSQPRNIDDGRVRGVDRGTRRVVRQ